MKQFISWMGRKAANGIVTGLFITITVTSITYALTYNWSDPTSIRNRTTGNPLTSAGWNLLVGNIDNLNERVTSAEGKLISGYMVGYVYTNNVVNSIITGNIPFDDTIPQNTEGTEIMNVTITPKSASNLLEIEGIVHYSEVINSSDYFVLAGFKDTATNAFATATTTTANALCSPAGAPSYTYICQTYFKATIPAGSTNPTIIHLRGGINVWSTEINGSNGRKLGGSLTSSLTVREIVQ